MPLLCEGKCDGFQEVVASHGELDFHFEPAVGGATKTTDVGAVAPGNHSPVLAVMRTVKCHRDVLPPENATQEKIIYAFGGLGQSEVEWSSGYVEIGSPS